MSDLASSLCCRRTSCKATANNVICLPKAPNQMKSKERSPGGRSSRYDDYDRDSRRRRSRSRSYERYRSRSPSYDRRRRRSESPREYVSSLRNISHFYHGLFITFFFSSGLVVECMEEGGAGAVRMTGTESGSGLTAALNTVLVFDLCLCPSSDTDTGPGKSLAGDHDLTPGPRPQEKPSTRLPLLNSRRKKYDAHTPPPTPGLVLHPDHAPVRVLDPVPGLDANQEGVR